MVAVFKNLLAKFNVWLDPPQPLPPHVRNVRIDASLALHIANADKPRIYT